MQVTYKNNTYPLGKKDRFIEGEAPAIRMNMINNETKVIGLMAPAVQVMISLNDISKYSSKINKIINSTKRKVYAYIVTCSQMEQIEDAVEKFAIDNGFCVNKRMVKLISEYKKNIDLEKKKNSRNEEER